MVKSLLEHKLTTNTNLTHQEYWGGLVCYIGNTHHFTTTMDKTYPRGFTTGMSTMATDFVGGRLQGMFTATVLRELGYKPIWRY